MKLIKRKGKRHSVYGEIIMERNIALAWQKVKKNKGAGGFDNETIEKFTKQEDINLQSIQRQLRQKRFTPKPVKRVMIPKPNGDKRPLGIPTVRDRIVQQAILNRIEAIYEQSFSQNSYGFRPKKSAQQAIGRVEELINKQGYD